VGSCSEPSPPASQPASHGCKIGGSYSTPMAHNWIACRACLWHPPTSGTNNKWNWVWIWTHQIPEFIGNWTHHKQSVIKISLSLSLSLSLSFYSSLRNLKSKFFLTLPTKSNFQKSKTVKVSTWTHFLKCFNPFPFYFITAS
jgi:hypothetical protein